MPKDYNVLKEKRANKKTNKPRELGEVAAECSECVHDSQSSCLHSGNILM